VQLHCAKTSDDADTLGEMPKNSNFIFLIKTTMKTTSEKIAFIFPAIIIFVIAPIILFPVIKQELDSGWARNEFYIAVFLQILFFLALSVYAFFNLKNNHWTQKYLMNSVILIGIGFYYYASLSYDSAFPTLAGLVLITIIYIIPALLILQLISILIKKFFKG
jgi:hypothetical protein